MRLEFAHGPVQRLRPRELLQQHLHPEIDREEPFGNQLGRLGRTDNPSAGGTIATGTLTVTHLTAAHQTHPPFHLLTLLRQARFGANLPAARTRALGFREGVMGHFFG